MAIFDYFSIWLVFQLKIVSLLEWKTENVDLLEGNLFRSYKYSLWVLIWQGSLRGSIYRYNVITIKLFMKRFNYPNMWKKRQYSTQRWQYYSKRNQVNLFRFSWFYNTWYLELPSQNRNVISLARETYANYNTSKAPLLEMEVREEKGGRLKRYIEDRICSERKPQSYCCLYPLTMDFVQLEFDFIIAPKR